MKINNSSKIFNITLWAAQIIIAALFFVTGGIKLFLSIDHIHSVLPSMKVISNIYIRLIGLVELIGGIGLLLPTLLKIKPNLTPLAAIGLAATMVFAGIFNVSIGDISKLAINIIVILIAAYIAWGRFEKSSVVSQNKVFVNSIE